MHQLFLEHVLNYRKLKLKKKDKGKVVLYYLPFIDKDFEDYREVFFSLCLSVLPHFQKRCYMPDI